jgi:hypothetical protein
MAVRLISELALGTGSKGFSFEVFEAPSDSDTYRKGLEIEESLKREEAQEEAGKSREDRSTR